MPPTDTQMPFGNNWEITVTRATRPVVSSNLEARLSMSVKDLLTPFEVPRSLVFLPGSHFNSSTCKDPSLDVAITFVSSS